MDVILTAVKWQFGLEYLDDIMIYSEYPEEYIGHVLGVLTLLNNAGITFRLKKWEFFTEKID